MVNVTVATAGTTGPRGNSWLSGAGAPTSNMAGSLDGDFYLDTTNVGYYYGPRSGGLWGSPHPFGNSLNGVPLNNITAVIAPTVSNDTTQGYSKGSYWINTTNNQYYVCTNAATGAAVWQQTIDVSTSLGGDLSGNLPSPTVAKVNGVTISGTPAAGQFVVASSSTSAQWQLATGLSTGLFYGGVMASSTSSQFTVSAGAGQVVNYTSVPTNPTYTPVTITSQTITLTTQQLAGNPSPVLYWSANSSGVISASATPPTPDNYRSGIQLGVTAVNGGALVVVNSVPNYLTQNINQMWDLFNSLGAFVATGNTITANGANLAMTLASGTLWSPGFNYSVDTNNPHLVTTVAESSVNFHYATRTIGSETPATVLDPTHYDNAGTLTSVGGGTGSSTIQRVFLFGTRTPGTQIAVQYGQVIYGTLAAATAAVSTEPFVRNPDLSTGTILASIAMTRICTSLQDTGNSAIIMHNKFPQI